MILSATGHRPPDLGGYSEDAFRLLVELAKRHIAQLMPDAVIQGMALGWDQAVGTAAWELGIPYGCYIPFEKQPEAWPKSSRLRWEALRENSEVERVFGQKYDEKFLKERNVALMTDGDEILANFNGYPYSGTAHAMKIAEQLNKKPINVYKEWLVDFNASGIKNAQ